jgi:endoglucanase
MTECKRIVKLVRFSVVGLAFTAAAPAFAATNLVVNGSFDGGTSPWWGTGNVWDSSAVSDAGLCVDVPAGAANPWDAIVGQNDVPLSDGVTYQLRFTASASQEVGITALVGEPNPDYAQFIALYPILGPSPQTFQQDFVMGSTAQVPQVAFQVGGADFAWTFCVDDVAIEPLENEVVLNGSFDDGQDPFWYYGDLTDVDVSSGAFCATAGASANVWDAGVGQTIAVEQGTTYTFSLFAQGDGPRIHATVQDPVAYAEPVAIDFEPTAAGDVYQATFTAPETLDPATLVIQVGGGEVPRSFCLDDISLRGGAPPPVYTPDTGPRVRVNQVAYLPFGPKHATLVTDATDPLAFQLSDADGRAVLAGATVPLGMDPSSGLNVHDIDFSSVTEVGEGYTLTADEETSYAFAIDETAYERLRSDTLRVYYTQRSGEAIDGDVAGAAYARPAGHISSPADGAVNQGDLDVPCQAAEDSLPIYGEPWTCDYTLDVAGGWYDAGDHGKYVVNGGISVYQLLNAFERTKLAPTADPGALGDGTLHVPEVGNGVPDVLDEARFELEFFLSMIVPEGEPLAGMVHHKVHDNEWTGLPLLPHEDPMTRWLHRPSTAATLNLVATAAQAARLFAPYDEAFSRRLLRAARRGWTAALAHPDLYAPAADGADGGGAYDDSDVSDEFYWAAAELYLTTGERRYLKHVLGSPHHTDDVFPPEGFYWGGVAALGRLDLALVPSALPDRSRVIQSVIDGANGYLGDEAASAFGHPYLPYGGVYVWGSNGQILNNLVVLAAAYDLTADESFRHGVLSGMDYLFGRNALDVSYVTGYGTVFSQNMHSRWYAHQLDPALPNPPLGTVAGGPNSIAEQWDPTAQRLFGMQGCAPQFCYVDDINSWSTNELAINWNAPLAWLASFVADQDEADGSPFGDCRVSYRARRQRGPRFDAEIRVENTGRRPLKDWELAFAFIGDQSVRGDRRWRALDVHADQEGSTVTVTPTRRNRVLGPHQSLSFTLEVSRGELANPEPAAFFLNGVACKVR